VIIGISGQAGSGKDTVADYLVKEHGFVSIALADPMKRMLMEVFGFSPKQLWGPSEERNEPDARLCRSQRENDDPSDICDILVNVQPLSRVNEDTYLTARYALQTLGTWGRECYQDIWVEYCLRVAEKLQEGSHYYDTVTGLRHLSPVADVMEAKKNVVISDIRYKNELEAIEKVGIVIRVKRGDSGLKGQAAEHSSETEQLQLDDDDFHCVMYNNGTIEDLHETVSDFMENKLKYFPRYLY
jgi:hypothetical protein